MQLALGREQLTCHTVLFQFVPVVASHCTKNQATTQILLIDSMNFVNY